MARIFVTRDKTKRNIRLTQERWKHIQQEHPQIQDMEEIRRTLLHPLKITPSTYSPENVRYYYRYNKTRHRYLMVAVRYLNGEGFIITTYYTRKIQ